MANTSAYSETKSKHSLSILLKGIDHVIVSGPLPKVTDIVFDSRQVQPGALFACITGERFDGHRFITDAVSNGAVAVIGSDENALRSAGVPAVLVEDTRSAMALLAYRICGDPSRRLKLIGVTGTNGKSTIVHLLQHILSTEGAPAGRIGTLGAAIGARKIPLHHTTPEAPEIAALLRTMADDGAQVVAMEVSSHGLALKRTLGCEFDVAVFTNLTQDHLDYHGSIEEYGGAKTILFTEYPDRSTKAFTAVINTADPFGVELIEITRGGIVTYGSPDAAVHAEDLVMDAMGSRFTLVTPSGGGFVKLGLVGEYNVQNAVAAAAAAMVVGVSVHDVMQALATADAPPGRLERVDCGQPFSVLVDYAHTPDALTNVLSAMRAITTGRLIVVFGCGGDRDRGKRPKMGAAAQSLADACYVTSDNPRSEDPPTIVREVLSGMDTSMFPPPSRGRARVGVVLPPDSGPDAHTSVSDTIHAIVDRREAIFAAIKAARSGDAVLIAGKGHEDYQILRDRTIHFDDREIAREALAEWHE